MKITIAVLALVLLGGLSGCVHGNWQGLVPMKDARFRDVKVTVTTPWGTQTFEAKEIDTRVNPGGNLDPMPNPDAQ